MALLMPYSLVCLEINSRNYLCQALKQVPPCKMHVWRCPPTVMVPQNLGEHSFGIIVSVLER